LPPSLFGDSIQDISEDFSAIFWGCGQSREKSKIILKNLFEPFAFCSVYVSIVGNDFAVRLGLA
jgi:hypothetical protein